MNYIHLSGRLGSDPQIIPYKNQNRGSEDERERFLVKFDLAVDRPWRPGQKDDPQPDWLPIVAFDGPSARFAAKALKKGDAVLLTGRLQTDLWETEDGSKRKSLNVVIVELEKSSGAARSDTRDERAFAEA